MISARFAIRKACEAPKRVAVMQQGTASLSHMCQHLSSDLQSDSPSTTMSQQGIRQNCSAKATDNRTNEKKDKEAFLHAMEKNEAIRDALAYSLSFADELSSRDDGLSFKMNPTARMRQQLANSENQLRTTHEESSSPNHKAPHVQQATPQTIKHSHNAPLPHTIEEALREKDRAVIITEAESPYRIYNVNKTWEGLCGYSFLESHGKTIGELMDGPETNKAATTALMSVLLRGEEAGAVLTNYKKNGEAFTNRLRVGPLMEDGEITHYVGVLQEM